MWSFYQKFIINMGDGRTPRYPRGPEKGDGTHACMVLSRQTYVQVNIVFATLHEDLRTDSSHIIKKYW